jgi:signal peptidase II
LAKSSRSVSRSFGGWLMLAFIVVLLDQLTKALVVRSFALAERKSIIAGFFDLTLLYNKGASFSFLANAGGWQRWFFIALGTAAALFIIYLLKRHASQTLFACALTLILGGAVGNVIDRIFHGQVVDFLLVYYDRYFWPAFNVADSAISIGAVLLICDEIRRVRRSKG